MPEDCSKKMIIAEGMTLTLEEIAAAGLVDTGMRFGILEIRERDGDRQVYLMKPCSEGYLVYMACKPRD